MILALNFLSKVTLTKILILMLTVFFILVWINFDSVLFGFWVPQFGLLNNFTIYFRNDNRRMSHLRDNLRFHMVNALLLAFRVNNDCGGIGIKTNKIFCFGLSFSLYFLMRFICRLKNFFSIEFRTRLWFSFVRWCFQLIFQMIFQILFIFTFAFEVFNFRMFMIFCLWMIGKFLIRLCIFLAIVILIKQIILGFR